MVNTQQCYLSTKHSLMTKIIETGFTLDLSLMFSLVEKPLSLCYSWRRFRTIPNLFVDLHLSFISFCWMPRQVDKKSASVSRPLHEN